jgi:hypothetical protein
VKVCSLGASAENIMDVTADTVTSVRRPSNASAHFHLAAGLDCWVTRDY